jgi:hypothetical protein
MGYGIEPFDDRKLHIDDNLMGHFTFEETLEFLMMMWYFFMRCHTSWGHEKKLGDKTLHPFMTMFHF